MRDYMRKYRLKKKEEQKSEEETGE